MALRSAGLRLWLKDDASSGLKGLDQSVMGLNDSVIDTQDNFSGLADDTSDFSYMASKDIGGVTDTTGELEEQTRSFGDRMRSVGDTVGRNWKAIAGGAAVAGAAIEGLIRNNQELERQTGQVAIAMGSTNEAVRDMIGGMTDYTFSTEDALSGAARLIQSGYDQEDQLKELLPLFDDFSDATGIHIVQAIDMVDDAFAALDKPLTDLEEHLDTFTFLQAMTTVETSELSRTMRYAAGDLKQMDLSIEDIAVSMAALQAEGHRGRQVTTEFRDAIEAAEGSTEAFWQELNVSGDALSEQRDRLADAAGLTRELADANNEHYTWLEKQHSQLMETNYAYGGLIANLDFLSPVLMGAATLLGTLAGAQYLWAGAIGTTIKGVLGFSIAVGAGITAPLWLVIGAVVAVGAAFWYFWDDVVALGQELANMGKWMYDAGASVVEGFVGGIISGYDWIKDAVTGIADTVTGGIKDIFGINSPSTLMMEFGVNMGEGLNLGLLEEGKGFFSDAARMLTPEREPARAVGGGAAFSIGDIYVQSNSDNPRGVAQEVRQTLRREFSTHAERYFARQRRRR